VPDLDDLIRQAQAAVGRFLPSGGSGKGLALLGLAFARLCHGWSSAARGDPARPDAMSDTKPTDPQSNLLPPERTPPSGPVPPAEAQADAAGEAAGDTLVFPSIVGLELGFNAAEDRVVMLARTHQSEIRVILLTRRMMAQRQLRPQQLQRHLHRCWPGLHLSRSLWHQT
jgi:hypothetical protein